MKREISVSLLVIGYLAVICAVGYADERNENIDFYLVVDKSLSMVEEISDVKDYIVQNYISQLIPGDNLYIVAFYGKAERIEADKVTPGDIDGITRKIRAIQADGAYTDIGNALDNLKSWLAGSSDPGDNKYKYMLLLTDGIQEAPPGSRYHVDDMSINSVNHEFLKNTRETKMKGWSIHVLGIGRESDAKKLAELLSASYEIADTAGSGSEGESAEGSGEEGAEGGSGFVPRQLAAGGEVSEASIKISSIRARGGKITLDVSAKFIDSPIDIDVSDIIFETPGGDFPILKNQVLFTLDKDETKTLAFGIEKGGLRPGKYSGTINFVFDSSYSFSPASFPAELKVNSFLENNLLWMIIVCLLLAGIIIFIIISIRNAAGRKDSEPKQKIDLMNM